MEDDVKLTLAEHLGELRTRLWKVVIAVLVLGGLAMAYARELFGVLMRPVLQALPEGSRSLVYTSGIEEINVLIKVGLYAGIFLATPVALYQLWLFVAPGLLKAERRLIAPFVTLGTLFFVGGALFCYLLVLPQMFRFLLNPGETGEWRTSIGLARARTEDAARLFWIGEGPRATELAKAAEKALDGAGANALLGPSDLEVRERVTRLGTLLDGAVHHPLSADQRKAVAEAITLHVDAQKQLDDAHLGAAAEKADAAAQLLVKTFDDGSGASAALWSAERRLATATARLGQEEWTRPMLSMREQLSLVLVLEIAFGAIFELPLLMALLAMMGLLRFRWVARYQRYAILACIVLSAIITPTGDVVNLSLMAVPMVFCFELGVLLVWIFERRRAARDENEASAAPL